MRRYCLFGLVFVIAWFGRSSIVRGGQQRRDVGVVERPAAIEEAESNQQSEEKKPGGKANAKKMVRRGIDWLVKAQNSDGGWSGGSHAHQNIRAIPNALIGTGTAFTGFDSCILAGPTIERNCRVLRFG